MSDDLAERWKQLPSDHVARSTKMPWYNADFEHKLTPSFRKVLEQWSGIAPDEVIPHIYHIREQGWKVFPWPCIGEFWFIEQGLLRHPDYARVLEKLKTSDAKFLDLGTCLGQDVRTLAQDGAPLSGLYGADVLPGFEAAGHALFKDEDRLTSSHFIVGDIFKDDDSDALVKTRGSWDVIHIAMFLHVFSKADQEAASKNILRLLKPVAGSTIIGTQTGTMDPEEMVLKPPLCEPGEHRTVFRQSKDTMKEMWEQSAKELGVEVDVWTGYDEAEAKQRAEGRKEKGVEWEKRERFFAGDREKRIFFRVERR